MTFISINIFSRLHLLWLMAIRWLAIDIGLTVRFRSARPCGPVIVIRPTSLPDTVSSLRAIRFHRLTSSRKAADVSSIGRAISGASDIGFHDGSQFVPIGEVLAELAHVRARRAEFLFLSSLDAIAGEATTDFAMHRRLSLVEYLSTRLHYTKLRAGLPRLCLVTEYHA